MGVLQQNKHETDFFYQQIFVDQTNFRHGITLRDGNCVFDVGANIGLFTMFVQQVWKDLTVYAFEPIPAIFDTLEVNVSLYGKNTKLFRLGLSNQSQEIEFTYYPHSTTQSGRYANLTEDQQVLRTIISNQEKANGSVWEEYVEAVVEERVKGETVVCQLKTLSEIIREEGIERIDLLKLDAEKSELDILEGVAETDWEKIRQVVIEAYESGGQLQRIIELLRRRGYGVVAEEDKYIKGSGLHNVYATRDVSCDQKTNNKLFSIPVFADTILTQNTLRQHLQNKLPEYLIPSAFVFLDRLPLSPTGKIDRGALPAPVRERSQAEETFIAPRNSVESRLAEAWRDVLKLERVGIHDNFFELGGDSILAMQICIRANNLGIRVTPKQLFEHETIVELSEFVGEEKVTQSDQDLVSGWAPLTPIQHWFFEQNLPEPNSYNQTILLEARQALDSSLLERAVRHLLEHHDLLRARYSRLGSVVEQDIAGFDGTVPFLHFDLSTMSETNQAAAMKEAIGKLQNSLNLVEGPLLRVALFDFGRKKPSRVFMTIHHIVVDGISWRVLVEDLQMLCEQLSRGATISLPRKTTSFKRWAECVLEYAQSRELQRELSYWVGEPRTHNFSLPVDYFGGVNSYTSASSITTFLTTEETKALLQGAPASYQTQINDVLLTALIYAFRRWTGNGSLLVDLEGHGREQIAEGIDLSRTVGWFAAIFPVLLDVGTTGDLRDALTRVKDQLRLVPNKGIGYGILRYLRADPEVKEKLRALPQSEVRFNYLGQFDQSLTQSSLFGWAAELPGPINVLRGPRRHLIEIDALVSGGCFQAIWTYSENRHERSTIKRLADAFMEALRSIIRYHDSPLARPDHLSDLLRAKLNPNDLVKIIRKLEQPPRGHAK
jgi:non-ribosomal peptide synthase protein (TIGR01720 family)/FkbM family methyltransferase